MFGARNSRCFIAGDGTFNVQRFNGSGFNVQRFGVLAFGVWRLAFGVWRGQDIGLRGQTGVKGLFKF
jgi:hypothetical protein